MSFESLMGVVQRLNASTEALAALGAELRLRREGAQADPGTRQLLQDILRGTIRVYSMASVRSRKRSHLSSSARRSITRLIFSNIRRERPAGCTGTRRFSRPSVECQVELFIRSMRSQRRDRLCIRR